MKVLIIYRPESEHATPTEEFIRDLSSRQELAGIIEVLNIDSREGSAKAALYDVVQYPGILLVDDFGSVIRSWQGEHFPLIDEITGYVHS